MAEKIKTEAAFRSQFVATNIKELLASDEQLRAALPLPAVAEAKNKPGLGLSQVIAFCMESYADRPALARRASELITDPATGHLTRRLLKHFETISYGELWARACALANTWYHDSQRSLRTDDLICIIGFSGVDFTTTILAAYYNGAVIVPLQFNAAIQQLMPIVKEAAPRWIATSLECLNTSIELVLEGHRPAGLLVFDYHPEVDDERAVFENAREKLAAAGLSELLITMEDACTQGGNLPPAPLFENPDDERRMCCIIYTSGSTGSPKGAMQPERTMKHIWQIRQPIPMVHLHYMPLNHGGGLFCLYTTLGSGGICYFTGKNDMSELLEDLKVVRPTYLNFVPRVCEMIYGQYKTELKQRSSGASDIEALKQELLLEMRNQGLGGRMLNFVVGSAPISSELRQFMEACVGFKMLEGFASTESGTITLDGRVRRPPVIDYKLDDVPELGYYKTDKPYPRGELWIKTNMFMLGYYKRPEITAQVMTEDGFYKTGDIMAEIAPDHLVYLDRRNNVIKLAQGEFVALAQLETLFSNGHPVIHQAYLYGTSQRAYLLGVFVPNANILKAMGIALDDEKSIKSALRDAIKEVALNAHLKSYEVPRDFIVEREPFSVGNGLLTGISKYQRPKFKERYSDGLERLYDEIAEAQDKKLQSLRDNGRNAPVLETVFTAIQAILGLGNIDLPQSLSFRALGGDSLSALACSRLLEEIYGIEVPASVINNPAGSLQQIERFIERALNTGFNHPTFASVHGKGATHIHVTDLVLDKFIDARLLEEGHKAAQPGSEILTVLVTGANGFLGRFLCLEWLERMAKVGGKVVCIARGQDDAMARERIKEALESGDPDLERQFEKLAAKHLEVLAGDLSEPDLGLSYSDWQRLAQTVDLIVHPAAFVNHVLPYDQLFGPNVVGTAELIRLAIVHHLKPINYVSTIAAAITPSGAMLDEDADVRTATPVRQIGVMRYADGYANSKWAGEALLREAHDRFKLPVAVFRADMILAHSRYKGQINVPDMFTRLLLSTALTGLAPKSFYLGDAVRPHYDGLPVDFIAEAIATLGSEARSGYCTYHVSNPHDDAISMDTFIDWLIEAGLKIQRIDDYSEWVRRFETALRGLPEKQRQHSSLPIIHQFYRPMRAESGAIASVRRFQAAVRKYEVGDEKEIPHLTARFIQKYLDDMRLLKLI